MPFDCEMRAVFKFLNSEGFLHLAYSPDLAPSDYHHTPGLKCDLGGQYFVTEENLQSAVSKFVKFFAEQDTEWYSAGTHKLISRCNMCLDVQGDYIEK